MQGISLSDVFLVVVGSVSTETHVLRAYLSHYGHSLNNLRRPRFPVWYKHFCWKPSALPNLDKLPKHSSFKFIYYNLMLFNISRKAGPCWRCILFSLHFTPYIYITVIRGVPIPICFYLFILFAGSLREIWVQNYSFLSMKYLYR